MLALKQFSKEIGSLEVIIMDVTREEKSQKVKEVSKQNQGNADSIGGRNSMVYNGGTLRCNCWKM